MMKETSELLKKTRSEKHLSLEEISSQTKIQLHILRALEDGQISDFRNTVFVKGFLKQYAKALGLDPVAVIKMFDQEHSGVTAPIIKSTPVAKLDDHEIHNKTNVLWFRTSSKFLTVGGVLIVFSLVTAIYFFSMKLISYSQETLSSTTDENSVSETAEVATNSSLKNSESPKTSILDEELTKEESLSLPEATSTPATENDKKTEEQTPATPAPAVAPSKPKMVTVEAFQSVEIEANWSTGKKESIKLKSNGKHIFYYADKLKLQINNGGGVGITTHQKEIGVPGELGQPTTLNFD